jgi:hypothetical protein
MISGSRIAFVPLTAICVCQPAQAMVYMTVEQAQQLMFGARQLTPLPLVLSATDIAAIEHDSGAKVFTGSLRAWKADDGSFFVDAVIGKHDLIDYAVALTVEGKVRQIEILEYREAYGGEVRNSHWRAQFVGRHHGDPVQVGQDIQSISGATLSCQHLTDGIRRLLSTYAIAIAGH